MDAAGNLALALPPGTPVWVIFVIVPVGVGIGLLLAKWINTLKSVYSDPEDE